MRNYQVFLICFFIISCRQVNKNSINTDFFIKDVFKQLTIVNFSSSIKEELLNNKHIDSTKYNETISLEIDSINNSIIIQSCIRGNTTAPCYNYYITSYFLCDSVYKIIYSNSFNSYADNNQNELVIYDYNLKCKRLMLDKSFSKVFSIHLKDFFKETTPDSIIAKYVDDVKPTYSFRHNKIFCRISDTGFANTLIDEPLLKGNVIEIIWTGRDFKIESIYIEK